MKNTTKILAIIFLMAFGFQSFAQTFGIKGGLNLAKMKMKDDHETYSDDFKMRPGFYVGGMVDFSLAETFSLQTGLFLSQTGFKFNKYDYKSSVSLIYLELPLTGKYRIDAGKVKIYLEFGPYAGLGLGGKSKWDYDDDSGSESIKFGKDEDLKMMDFGLRFGGGVEINSIQIGINYGLGLANVSHDNDDGYKIKNNVLGITLGYWFKQKKEVK